MNTPIAPKQTVPLNWWQRVAIALGFTAVVFIGDFTARVLFDRATLLAALHANHSNDWAFAFVLWFVMGLALPFVLKVKPNAKRRQRGK